MEAETLVQDSPPVGESSRMKGKKQKKDPRSVESGGEGTTKKTTRKSPRSMGMSAAVMLQKGKKGKKTKQAASRTGNQSERPTSEFGGLSSRLAFEKFQKNKHKVALIDKGFDAQSVNEYSFIKQVVDSHKLDSLCKIPNLCNLTLVKEFYAELAVTAGQKLKVRGMKVIMSAKKINRMLGFRPPKRTEYQEMLANATEETLVEVSNEIGIPDALWDNHPNFMKRYFRGCDLKNDANVWVKFIKHSINPTTHDSGLSVERMFLLFCLMQGKSINFGKIILESMRNCSKLTRGRLYFPGLLTQLLMSKGVPVYEDDEILKPTGRKWQIDLTTVARLRDRRPGQVHETQSAMMQTLLGQNQALMDNMLQQGVEWQKKMEAEGVKQQAEILRQKEKVRSLKLKVQMLEVEKSKVEEENVVLKEMLKNAGTKGAGTSAAARMQQGTHPTPRE